MLPEKLISREWKDDSDYNMKKLIFEVDIRRYTTV